MTIFAYGLLSGPRIKKLTPFFSPPPSFHPDHFSFFPLPLQIFLPFLFLSSRPLFLFERLAADRRGGSRSGGRQQGWQRRRWAAAAGAEGGGSGGAVLEGGWGVGHLWRRRRWAASVGGVSAAPTSGGPDPPP